MNTHTTKPCDQTYLQSIIDATETLCEALPQAMFTIKHLDSTHVFCSSYWAKQMQMPLADIIGNIFCNHAYDFNTDIEQQILAEDQFVITGKQTVVTLKVTQTKYGLNPYYFLKSPIINPSTDTIVGILCQGFHLSAHTYQDLMINKAIGNTDKQEIPNLTKREKEVIFLFLSHLNSQQIANTLSQLENKKVTKSTVDSVFNDKLYLKFNTYNRQALFEKLITLGFSTLIPQELLAIKSMIISPIKTY